MFDISLYNEEFFEWHVKHAREYSIKTMDWYIQKYKPMSVVDFGCGIGSYLESAFNHNLSIKGFDISEVAQKYTPEKLWKYIDYYDCTIPMYRTLCDTVLSFETAEHISPEGTKQFVKNLAMFTGKHLLFTAAPPGQEGTGHINLRPKEFWIDQFSKELTFDGELTKDISTNWRRLGAPDYICNNLITFHR
jgi:cyclopropane fatty-acyl-phospholipid synthase-like methyltransferase